MKRSGLQEDDFAGCGRWLGANNPDGWELVAIEGGAGAATVAEHHSLLHK